MVRQVLGTHKYLWLPSTIGRVKKQLLSLLRTEFGIKLTHGVADVSRKREIIPQIQEVCTSYLGNDFMFLRFLEAWDSRILKLSI